MKASVKLRSYWLLPAREVISNRSVTVASTITAKAKGVPASRFSPGGGYGKVGLGFWESVFDVLYDQLAEPLKMLTNYLPRLTSAR